MTASAHVGSTPHNIRIESMSACTISVPLADPVSLSTRRVTARDYTLVKFAATTASRVSVSATAAARVAAS
jgi:hypothetical protein